SALMEQSKDGVAIVAAAPELIRNHDVHYPYRQDSTFYYLSGYTEPEAILVLDAMSPSPFTMFVREKDPTRELWDGFRYGIDGAAQYFGANKVHPISEFEKLLPDLVKNADKIYYKLGEQKEIDEKILTGMQQARKLRGRSGLGMQALVDLK